MSDGKVKIDIEGDASDFKSKLSSLGSTAVSAGKTIATGIAAGTAAATVAVAALATEAVNAFGEYEQLAGGVETIFDEADTARILRDAGNAYETLNMSANDYLTTINQVGAAFASTMGDQEGYDTARQGMIAIADYASGTGRNLDELNEKYTLITRSTSSYQSIADQFSGILPATSDAFLEQAQAAGWLSTEYTSLTEVPLAEYQQAVTQALASGVDALGLTGNTAEEAERTLTGSFAAMTSEWDNLLVHLADEDRIDSLSEEVGKFVSTVSAYLNNLIPIVSATITGIAEALPVFVEELSGQLMTLISDNVPQLVSAIIQAVTVLANEIAATIPSLVAQLSQIMVDNGPQLISAMTNVVTSLVTALVSSAPQILEAGLQMFIALVQSVSEALPQITAALTDAIPQITEVLVDNAPQLLEAAVEFFVAMCDAIAEALPEIVSSLGEGIVELVSHVGDYIPDMISAGANLLLGLATGIGSAVSSVVDAALAACGSVLSNILSFFGIHSPSKLMADLVGGNLMLGIPVGMKDEEHKTLRAINGVMGDVADDMEAYPLSAATSAAASSRYGSMYGSNNNTWTIGKVVVEAKDATEASNVADFFDTVLRRATAWQ